MEISSDIPSELAPLAWLIGVWEGTGIVHYNHGETTETLEFGQRISFSHDGLPYLNYTSSTWRLSDGISHVSEMGYWRLSRPATPGDPGPGMLGPVGDRPYRTASEVEELRNKEDGFDVEASIVHPEGVTELYLGQVRQARIDLATDAVVRTAGAKDYAAATRLYGFVEDHLLWAWDIAALGRPLASHASGRLAKVD
ncbi:hypothetical protein M2152_000250 [Microbacteriaceae bacterium SG_E_30_P1]|uniref:Peroxynitrite isomerase n=2 Tax=Antiquaquibacter oligotrophicus TaxID=2880260 RepID=A0ABT6KKU1_9MICO|nr:hypothetical protein [Antiquaquibacter oligotrophicus]